jgi:peptidoglycan/xylan/chitin deacetylase (PgdA/CDA1 family)
MKSRCALEWPVDDSLDLLQRFLLRLILIASGRTELQFAWFWPDRHPSAVVLTHDVETADGLANITRVMEMETARGFRSSFNFVPVDYAVPATLLQELQEGGFEVGVHGYTHDGLLFSSWSTFRERVGTINEFARLWKAKGFRSPATYRNLEWFHLLEFEYDSSVSNTSPCEPQPGGCGSFFPYPVDGLIELPITLPQDHTLFELLAKSDASTWLASLARIEEANGMACVLTHPDPGTGYVGCDGNDAHYAALLDAVAASDAWTPLPRDLARWWRVRAETPMDQIASIEGISFGRATLNPSGRLEISPPSVGGRQ